MPTLILAGANYEEALQRLPPEWFSHPPQKKARIACVRLNLKACCHCTTAISWSERDTPEMCASWSTQQHSKVVVCKWSDGELLCEPNLGKEPKDFYYGINKVPELMSDQLYRDVLVALNQECKEIGKSGLRRRSRMAKESWQMMGFFEKDVEDRVLGGHAGNFFSQIFNVLPTGGVGAKPCGTEVMSTQAEFMKAQLKELLRHAKTVSISHVKSGLREGTAVLDPTGSGFSSSLLLKPHQDETNLKDSGQNRLLWVVHWERLQKFMWENHLDGYVGRIGQVVLVKSVSGWKVSVSPPLDLHKFGVDLSESRKQGGHRVAVLELADIQPWINMFGCLKAAMDGNPKDLSLSVGYLGFCNPEIEWTDCDVLYGNPGSRRQFIEDTLPTMYGIRLTQGQAHLIYNLGAAISVWDMFAGFGKSLLLAISARLFHRENDTKQPDRIAYVVAPTRETCAELVQTLSTFFDPQEILQIRVVEEDDAEGASFVDLEQTWVDRIAINDLSPQFTFLNIVDDHLDALSSDLQNRVEDAPQESIYRAVTELFALRHCFLHLVLYEDLTKSRQEALKAVKVVVCTIQDRLKLKGKIFPWDKMLGERTHEVLLMDEMEGVGKLQAASCLVGAHSAIFSGDENQDSARNSMTRQTGSSCISMCASMNVQQFGEDKWYLRPNPLHFLPVPQWACFLRGTAPPGFVDPHKGFQTQSLGNDVVALLKHVFPYLKENGLVSHPEAPNTLICPVFVDPKNSDWQYTSRNATGTRQEVTKSAQFFNLALAILVLEVVLLSHSSVESERDQGNILVMWSLSRPLREFESFVSQYFTLACVAMHRSLGFPWSARDGRMYTNEKWLTDTRYEGDL